MGKFQDFPFEVARCLKGVWKLFVHKTLKCSSTSWAACWKQGRSAPLCLSPLSPGLSLFPFAFSVLVTAMLRPWPFLIPVCCLLLFLFPHRMFAWSQWIHKLILLSFYLCKKIYEGVSVWSRFDVPQGQGSSPQLLKAAGFCFAKGAPCLASLLCYYQITMLPCISTTFTITCGLNSQQWETVHLTWSQ